MNLKLSTLYHIIRKVIYKEKKKMRKEMKNALIVLVMCLIIAGLICGINVGLNHNKTKNTENRDSSITNEEIDANYNLIIKDNPIETIENTTIQGIVEIKHNGYIYIFNGEHFGEYGFEMNEYTRTNIDDKKQKCIDYYSKETFDTSYIQEGDLIICTGDLKKYNIDNDFDTKDNSIIVLKEKDYNQLKKEFITNKKNTEIIIGEYFDMSNLNESSLIYLKYDISDKKYKLPFALNPTISNETKIIGNLEKGKKVKVEYKNTNVSINELELKTIEVIE